MLRVNISQALTQFVHNWQSFEYPSYTHITYNFTTVILQTQFSQLFSACLYSIPQAIDRFGLQLRTRNHKVVCANNSFVSLILLHVVILNNIQCKFFTFTLTKISHNISFEHFHIYVIACSIMQFHRNLSVSSKIWIADSIFGRFDEPTIS